MIFSIIQTWCWCWEIDSVMSWKISASPRHLHWKREISYFIKPRRENYVTQKFKVSTEYRRLYLFSETVCICFHHALPIPGPPAPKRPAEIWQNFFAKENNHQKKPFIPLDKSFKKVFTMGRWMVGMVTRAVLLHLKNYLGAWLAWAYFCLKTMMYFISALV